MKKISVEAPKRQPFLRPAISERGMALIMVVIILTSLLILGTLFLQTAHLELTAATYYKSSNEAEIMAHSGFARATAELMYDVWGANEVRPFVADRWSYFKDDTSRDRFNVRIQRDIYTPMKLGEPYGLQGTGNGAGGFYKDDGEIHYAYERNGQPIDQIRSITTRREKELYFQRPKKNLANTSTSQKDNVTTRALTDWDAWHVADGYDWSEALKAGSPDGTEGYGSEDIWKFGALRWHDAFLPRSNDVNDCWEYGLMANRIFKNSDGVTMMMDRNYAGDANTNYETSTSSRWPIGLEFMVGTLQERSTTSYPWNYIDSHRICSDSFFRVFRYELVDESLNALDSQGNAVLGAYHLGAKAWGSMVGTSGPAINLNQVNNNYDYEQWNDHGKVNPFITPLDNDAVRPQMYHYNEAKWIYIYDEDGNPRGRYAVTIHPDGGMVNINSFKDTTYTGGLDINRNYETVLTNLFWQADNGYSVQGYNINTSSGGGYLHSYSKNMGVNFFRVGRLNDVLHPVTKTPVTVAWPNPTRMSDWSATTAGPSLHEFSIGMQNHVCAYKYLYGPLSSRTEIALYFRKYGFLYQEDLNNNGENPNSGFDQNGDSKVTGSDIAIARLMGTYVNEAIDPGDMRDDELIHEDALRLSSIFGPHAYNYTFDRFWDTDRIIVDYCASPENAGSQYETTLSRFSTADPKQGYYDPRGIGSWNMDTTDINYTHTGTTSGSHTFYNFKINSASAGLVKFSRILSNTRYLIGADSGQWSPLSPHAKDSRKQWRQASKAQSMLLAGMMNKASGFRFTGNGIEGHYEHWAPYVSYGVRVDFLHSPTLGSGNKLSDPLIEVYPNPSRKMLLADIEGSANSWGGEQFTKGFSDIRINNPGLMLLTEVGRAPVLGDPRNFASFPMIDGPTGFHTENWYNHLPGGYDYVMNGAADWKASGAIGENPGNYLTNQTNVDRTGYYHLYVLAADYHSKGGAAGSFSLEKKPPIMNYIEFMATHNSGNNSVYLTALGVQQVNVFTNTGVPVGGLKSGRTPDGTYLWTRGLFYSGEQSTDAINPNTWYVLEVDLFNPWCINTTWPSFDDATHDGAFAAWELTSVSPHEIDVWDLSTGLTKVTDAAALQTLKRRLFGWRGDMVFVRGHYYRRNEPNYPNSTNEMLSTSARPDTPVRILCRGSTSGNDIFGHIVSFTHAHDVAYINNVANVGWDNFARRNSPLNTYPWYDVCRGDARIDTVISAEYFNYLDGWWDPSNSAGGGRGKFCIGYTHGYHHLSSNIVGGSGDNEVVLLNGVPATGYWTWVGAHPHQYLTVWFHPYFFPMLIIYGAANYGQGGLGSTENPYDRVYDFALLPNYLRSNEPVSNATGHFEDYAQHGVLWWDYGGSSVGSSNSAFPGLYNGANFWTNSPSYPGTFPATGMSYSPNPYTDIDSARAPYVVVNMPTNWSNSALRSGDGMSATGNYGRKDTEALVEHIKSNHHFFTCSVVSFFDNDDPGNWVYAWTETEKSFSWRHKNLVEPSAQPMVNEVQYSVIHTNGTASGAKDDRLILSKSIFINGRNIGKKVSSHIYPTPGNRNCVWMYDALFYSCSNEGDPDATADPHEWPWYEHNDGGPVQKEYAGMYDWNGNNRWNSWYACVLGGELMIRQLTADERSVPAVSTYHGRFFATRKLDFMSLPIGYLDLTAIDPHLTSYNQFEIQCGMSELFELGINGRNRNFVRGYYQNNFWGDTVNTYTRKMDANFHAHTYRDAADNDLDGVTDIATDRPFSVDVNGNNLFAWWTDGGDPEKWLDVMQTDINHANMSMNMTSDSNGYYNSDRKTGKKVFVNLAFYPMVISYLTGFAQTQALNTIIGKKPLLGFHDERQFLYYWTGYWGQWNTPFYLRVNDKNRFWNYSLAQYGFLCGEHQTFVTNGLFTEFGVSPVYTILVTGQTITPDGKPHAQSKIEATVERTWDGKMNVLEYRLVPGMMDE